MLMCVDLTHLGGPRIHKMHPLKYLRANYAECYSSKQDRASLSGKNGLFYTFLRCEENGTGLPECT